MMSFSPEGLVHLRRQPEGKGYRETVIFGLGQGEQSPSEETEEPDSFRLSYKDFVDFSQKVVMHTIQGGMKLCLNVIKPVGC